MKVVLGFVHGFHVQLRSVSGLNYDDREVVNIGFGLQAI